MQKIISLGAGVQSTTMLLMSLHGDLPRADCAIFADTGFEPRAVYEHLNWLSAHVWHEFDFEIHEEMKRETKASRDPRTGKKAYRVMPLATDAVNPETYSRIPFFVKNDDGSKGILSRQCTRDWKVDVVKQKIRRLSGLRYRQPAKSVLAEMWLGISTDEASRMKDSPDRNFINRFPLIEQSMSRADCLAWMTRHGYPKPPKSACIGCPFHDDNFWRDMKENSPGEWQQAVEFDRAIRCVKPTVRQPCFVHSSLKPLSEVDFSILPQPNAFINECEGHCGL